MLKLVLNRENDDDRVVMLGLTQPNIHALTHGEPILIQLEELGIGAKGRLLITYGQDQAAVVRLWRDAGVPLPDLPEPQPGQKIRMEP